jgi:hypothetical protein
MVVQDDNSETIAVISFNAASTQVIDAESFSDSHQSAFWTKAANDREDSRCAAETAASCSGDVLPFAPGWKTTRLTG